MMTEELSTDIHPAQLLELYNIGFKLVPLGIDSTPVIPWTAIYENTEYWNPEKLVQEASKFKNGVATVFGKTRFADDKGPLYLYSLDIDSKKVYDILTNLENRKTMREYSLIPPMQERTFVVKTRKPYGYHIYWLSHKEHRPILTADCKTGYEFEIKGGKNSGHSTLPSSRHRVDPSFIYKNYGQQKLFVSDDLYGRLIATLADCLRPKVEDESEKRKERSSDGQTVDLSDLDVQKIAEYICPSYKNGRRHPIVFGLAGLFHKCNISKDSAMAVIELLAKDNSSSDVRNARGTVEEVFGKNANIVAGSKYLLNALTASIEDSTTAKEILDKIVRIIGKGDSIQWLTRAIMNEFTVKTMSDNEEIFLYDEEKGVYVEGQEWRIKELCQMMYPKISTRQLYEIINQIKRRTYIDRKSFDSNIDIINVKNGSLNIDTLEFREHSPDELSLVQLPLVYDSNAKCPNILRFLGQVLKPKDVFTALELFGYSLYRTSRYQKALLCVGKGANGKSTFLSLFEHFLGKNNVAHLSLQDIVTNRFALAGLYGKSANIFADLKNDKLTNTGPFKMLVAGDPMKAEKKHCQPFDFENYAKLIFSANEIPQSEDKTYAYYRRWIIFFFENVFEADQNDPNLIDKITTHEEMSGLLNLSLIALKQLRKDNGFIHIADISSIEKDYTLNSNNVERFVRERCEITGDDEDFIICRDLWSAYLRFCKNNKLHSKDDHVFGMELRAFQVKRERRRIGAEREYCYVGIRLKD
ncbi:DNA primase family protein [Nitrososphaera sp. AFS]|uniref:DNA primase family protein n=1 Tax=Nitrososphaera sp. AFS TaxID=2301191 RepID=UPI0013924077|nr:phage/plasmid primase, P4 family [Nitrososphaera sp. AFS]NAL78183.1 hypothetical protein [Nitrososphaera sp. AFS]